MQAQTQTQARTQTRTQKQTQMQTKTQIPTLANARIPLHVHQARMGAKMPILPLSNHPSMDDGTITERTQSLRAIAQTEARTPRGDGPTTTTL